MSTIDLLPILEASNALLDKLENANDKTEEAKSIEEHIDFIESLPPVIIPEFKPEYDWLNTKQLLKKDLQGKIVVLDFFTYCCLNCLNLLPTLRKIEERFAIQDGLVMVGVHSAKFDNERILENVRNAVRRHDIRHPVVNDSQGYLWNELDIPCWPTLIILGPHNEVLFELLGEGPKEKVEQIIETTLNYFKSKNSIGDNELSTCCEQDTCIERLSFPGKISVNSTALLIAISDSGNNRILVTDFEGHVLHTIGGKDSNYINGSFDDSRFQNPQGICWASEEVLYIADTGNHVIREINLRRKEVSSVAGTGCQGSDKLGGLDGTNQILNSPWDICLGPSTDEREDCVLFIAMAGLHQIWALFLKNGTWMNRGAVANGTCFAIAGSGNEENRNNRYPHRASFAQPSGICYASVSGSPSLIIADSESSTLRVMSLLDGSVKNIVGGDKNPLNLFAFGDVDGVGTNAKLQHPLGVTWLAEQNQLFVCDTYNHKIKLVDLKECRCYTFAGMTNISDYFEVEKFNEPGGLDFCCSRNELYIADTNNHQLKIIDLMNHSVRQFQLSWDLTTEMNNVSVVDGVMDSLSSKHIRKKLPVISVQPESVLKVQLNLQLEAGYHLTENAPHSWKIHLNDSASAIRMDTDQCCGRFYSLNKQPLFELKVRNENINSNAECIVSIETSIYFCSEDGKCHMKNIVFHLPIEIGNNGHEHYVELNFTMSPGKAPA